MVTTLARKVSYTIWPSFELSDIQSIYWFSHIDYCGYLY